MPERWLPVVGWEGRYEVSDLGRVRSLKRRGVRNTRQLKLVVANDGYAQVVLCDDGYRSMRKVHLLVMEHFIGPRPGVQQARHLNGDATDNRVSNLAWGTASENVLDNVRNGTHPHARKLHCNRGHPYDDVNTYTHNGKRHCRICRKDHDQKRKMADARTNSIH